MSIYKSSTLAMIPTAYKDGKLYSVRPTDGSGDFTFSRGSNLAATRVSSSGYIEKGRENLSLYSNTFSSWTAASGGSVTSGQSGYDGTNDAWLLTSGAATYSRIERTISHTGLYTISVYAKAGTLGWLSFENSGISSDESYFDLTTGTLGSLGANVITANIESIGSGWYRCSATLNGTSATQRIYPAVANGDLNSAQGNIYIQDFQLEQGLVATDYIETTTTSVSAGILEDMPRLDYSSGSCPSLLLEPQRSNTITASEYFDGSNLTNVNISAEYNTTDTLSPQGVYNAVKLTATGSFPRYYAYPTIGDNVNVSLAVFAKEGSASVFTIRGNNKNNEAFVVDFDLANGTAELSQYDELTPTFDIVDMGNGWYRCSVNTNTGSGATAFQIRPISHAQGETGGWSGSNYIYAYGAQMEQDATYPTSYIPTYGSAVTRSAESCLAASVSDLIGQTEGTLFFECTNKALVQDSRYFILSDGTANNRIDIYHHSSDRIGIYVATSGAAQVNITNVDLPASGSFKFALAYANNDYVWYVNGTQEGTDTSASVPSCTDTLLATNSIGNASGGNSPFKQAVLFKTRLTNDELASLTTL